MNLQEVKPDIAALIETVKAANILKHLKSLVGEREPVSSPKALQVAGVYIEDQFKSYGLQTSTSEISSSIDATGQACFNVIAQTPEEDGKELLLIGAHYDTVLGSPGADDNASSLAVLLELARVLAPMGGQLKLQFAAFSLEESGFIGSTAYLNTIEEKGDAIWGAIILECVGYTDSKPQSQRTPPGLPFALPEVGDFIGLLGNLSAEPIKTAFETAVETYVPGLPQIAFLVPGKGEMLPDSRRSDHVPFWDKGHRAVMLTDTANFRNPHYHQRTDTIETLDLSFITKVVKSLVATVVLLAELEQS